MFSKFKPLLIMRWLLLHLTEFFYLLNCQAGQAGNLLGRHICLQHGEGYFGLALGHALFNALGLTIGKPAALFLGAPGRALELGGASPPQARHGELLAGRQGCPP